MITLNLKEVLSHFFDAHQRVEVRAVLAHFREPESEIRKYIEELVAEGHIKISKSYVHQGMTIDRPIIVRTKKLKYSQLKMFDIF